MSDATLLARAAEWRTAWDALNARHDLSDEQVDAATTRDNEARHAIAATPACTVAGVLAKLRIAWEDIGPAVDRYGNVDGMIAEQVLLKSAIDDLERMVDPSANVLPFRRKGDAP